MTDNTAPNPAPASPDPAPPSQNWEVVTFPGQVAIPEAQMVDNPATSPAIPEPDTAAPTPDVLSTPVATAPATESLNHRTAELIQLIQDLNQCNDALLVRVSDLEESLERSQTALQAEVERHQGQGCPMGNERPSPPQPVPQQIAQLLTEIDIANDGLRRATIHNETLQTELESSQQRVAQLERECTLLQQRFSEKSTALQQAEDSCRDLKARLHRQQRYTLQFKTALEKCLNMSGEGSAQEPLFAAASRAAEVLHPVAMPKAPEIQPWSAQADPNPDSSGGLANLLHSLKTPGIETVPAPPTATPVMTAPLASLPTSLPVRGEVPPLANPVEQIAPVATPSATETPSPVTAQSPVALAASAPLPEPPMPPQPTPWSPSLAPQPEPEAPIVFTEPSPWGAPMVQPPATPAPQVAAALATPEPLPVPDRPLADRAVTIPAQPPTPRPEPTTPAYLSDEDLNGVTPAPVVYPLRSQKKIPSLAAVQLPSFGRSARRS